MQGVLVVTTDKLYKLDMDDKAGIVKLLVECFKEDPLYCTLIPNQELRERTLPEVFDCDLEEMFQECDIYADSKDMNGIIIVEDEMTVTNPIRYFKTEAFYTLKTDAYLIKEDKSFKTLWNFIRGKEYLNSHWTNVLPQERLHIIYFAVNQLKHGRGIAHRLITPILNYADENSLWVSLETHNPKNLCIYRHYGFREFRVLQCHMDLKQYCMLRPCKI